MDLGNENARQTVLQGFQILNNFDIPLGIEFAEGTVPVNIPSATQWTSATDMRHRMIYYRTMYNSAIRSIDLNKIDFQRVKYRAVPLDTIKEQPVMEVLSAENVECIKVRKLTSLVCGGSFFCISKVETQLTLVYLLAGSREQKFPYSVGT